MGCLLPGKPGAGPGGYATGLAVIDDVIEGFIDARSDIHRYLMTPDLDGSQPLEKWSLDKIRENLVRNAQSGS